MRKNVNRRVFIQKCAQGLVIVAGYPFFATTIVDAKDLTPTPPNTAGPFYMKGSPITTNLKVPGDKGRPLTVKGKLINTSNEPLPQGTIEVWHADSSGGYDMDGYRHRGQIPIGKSGDYRFDTDMPAPYGGRPQHIHYRISAPGHETLTTQLYFATDPFWGGDPLRNFRRDPLVGYRELIQPVELNSNEAFVFFQIVLKKA